MDGRWCIVRGTPVYFRGDLPACDDGGAAARRETILHLHGFAISGAYMVPTAGLLADRYRTYVPDLPGFGRSPRPEHPLTIPDLADTAAAFLDAVGVQRAAVLGNSLGCAILAAFAERHPDRIGRAVMVSPAGGIHSRPLIRAVGQLLRDVPREPISMAAVAMPDYVHFGVADSFRLFRAMTRFPALKALLHLRIPLLAVLGARDPLLPPVPHIRDVIERMGPDVTVAVLRDAAHAINFSHPEELAALVAAFLDGELTRGSPLPAALAATPGRSPAALFR